LDKRDEKEAELFASITSGQVHELLNTLATTTRRMRGSMPTSAKITRKSGKNVLPTVRRARPA
jgi:hypothetical protein